MKNHLTLALMILLSGCVMAQPIRPDRVNVDSISGCYRSDGLSGYDFIDLKLNTDGHFNLLMRGHLGSFGSSSGNWNVVGNSVRFIESEAVDQGKGYLDTLIIGRRWPSRLLARSEDEIRSGWGSGIFSPFYKKACPSTAWL